jgi:nicotinate-nucleotide pyrophosphorylase (carboxylating)
LAEDIGPGDATTTVSVPVDRQVGGRILSRREGVVAGLPLVEMVFGELSRSVQVQRQVEEGVSVRPGAEVALVSGPAAPILTGERTALNFLQNLSGIATLTAQFVSEVAGTNCRILDTRKTVPGYRELAKYAVRAGGGYNHRLGLYDRIMFKDNHWIAGKAPIQDLVSRARKEHPNLAIEVEVDSMDQLARVLPLGVDWILLDNFPTEDVAESVRIRNDNPQGRKTRLEASGGIHLENVREYAQTGVDAISVGYLTHSAPALDLSLELEWFPSANQGGPR